MRSSTIITEKDTAGSYDIEIFESPNPKSIVICAHGRGVRRWDGEDFFYNVAEYYPDHTFFLVDQNQFDGDICRLNTLPVIVQRVQDVIRRAQAKYEGVPIVVLGHSMGCGIATQLDLQGVDKVIFAAPTAGNETEKLVRRYGDDIREGKMTTSVDDLKKYISHEYFESVDGITWEEEYQKLLDRYKPVYVFEAGDEEIVGEDRFAQRDMSFASYKIIPGATHNFSGEALQRFFTELDQLI